MNDATDHVQETVERTGQAAGDTSHDSSFLHADAFTCPHCGTYAPQHWADRVTYQQDDEARDLTGITASACENCGEALLWRVPDGDVIHPDLNDVPRPRTDMPADVRAYFDEARDVVDASPRAAVALLRIAVDQLVEDLGAEGGSRQVRVRHLTENGLHNDVYEALRTVRVVGPEAVPPGVIDEDDDRETAYALFELLNIMVEQTITHEKQIGEIRDRVGALRGTDRDSGTTVNLRTKPGNGQERR